MSPPLLEVAGLTTDLATSAGTLRAVDGVDFEVARGEALALVGESGSGKTMTCLSLVRLLPPVGRITAGSVRLEGEELTTKSDRAFRRLRGSRVSMILQDPLGSLDPVYTIGNQLAETIRLDRPRPARAEVRARSVEALTRVHITEPERRLRSYPFEFSGGMRQRVSAAIALARDPALLIADEPTTALDVTIQAQIVEVLKAAQRETHAATILITHDLGLIAELADRVIVMYAGRVVEHSDVFAMFKQPGHPYTVGLMNSLARLDADQEWLEPIPGQPPSLVYPPPGCAFHPRCKLSQGRMICRTDVPPLRPFAGGEVAAHSTACHFAEELITMQVGARAAEPVA